MNERLTHSKLAVASTILPVAVWVYLGLFFLLLSWKPFFRFLDWIFGGDSSLGALGVILILAIFLFGVIPIAGHIAGAICGIVGLFFQRQKTYLRRDWFDFERFTFCRRSDSL